MISWRVCSPLRIPEFLLLARRDRLVSTGSIAYNLCDRTVSLCIEETGIREKRPDPMAPAPSTSAYRPPINPWVIAITVTLATFMELLDTAIANVALPHIAGGLAVSVDESTWVLTSYLVSNAVVLPLSAWLSRVFGRKRYYMVCVVLFTASSLLCGLAPSLGLLFFFACCKELEAAGWLRSSRRFLWIHFRRRKGP